MLRDGDAAVGLDPLLAHLPMITKLDLMGPLSIQSRLPTTLLSNGFASLRAVALHFGAVEPTGLVQLAEAFTGLKSLKLLCDGAVAHAFLSHLPCLRNLTELDLEHESLSDFMPVGISPSTGCTFLGFLAELQDLKRLALDDMVDARFCDDEVRYIAALTELTKLSIMSLQSHRLTSAQVQPLTKLVRLKELFSSGPWGPAFRSSDFSRALHGRQYELGLPRTLFTWSK
eukprot:jgi/Botrbrau1/20980/Bobra.0789s0002.1